MGENRKNYAKGFSDAQVKVREATSNDPWGPSGTIMNEIAQLTYNEYVIYKTNKIHIKFNFFFFTKHLFSIYIYIIGMILLKLWI